VPGLEILLRDGALAYIGVAIRSSAGGGNARRNRPKSASIAAYRRHFGHSCPKWRTKQGAVRFDFANFLKRQGGHLQDIREKAAEGIRTLDLLHGKQTL
jgi:hypothetical protein